MTTDTEIIERRGFYFFFTHNEWPDVCEQYSFKAELRFPETGETRTYDSASHPFWYRRLPRPDRDGAASFSRIGGQGLSSDELPALVVFADDMPSDARVEVDVESSDQLQRQWPASVREFRGRFMHCWRGEPLMALPMLPNGPRIFLKPLTYEYQPELFTNPMLVG